MNIKQLILTTSGLLLAGIVEAQSAHPNVILIYTDDHGSLDVNCFGAKDLCTPHMDALANQGVRFTQFYGAAVSSVSRASLLTGQFAKRAGLTVNAGGNSFLPVEKETIAERMKSNGYRTALIGKWHLGDRIEQGPNAQGFDYFWGIRGGCVDNYSHFYYWGGPNRHDLWQNEREIYSPGNFFAAENLKESVERWNELCENGFDEDFGLAEMYLKPIDTPPYWGVRQWVRITAVHAGFEVNKFNQALDENGEVIPGLYGVGFTGGDLCGDVDWSFYLGGLCCGYCMTSGRYAVIHALTGDIEPSSPVAWSDDFAAQYGVA